MTVIRFPKPKRRPPMRRIFYIEPVVVIILPVIRIERYGPRRRITKGKRK